MADLVTLRTYLDPLEANAAKAALQAGGVRAHVFEPTAFNPLYTVAAGGIRLDVSRRDVEHAEIILNELAEAALRDDHEDEEPVPSDPRGNHPYREPGLQTADEVRCPRCELTYCFHEKSYPRFNTPAALVFLPILLLDYIPTFLFGQKRWHCRRCEYVWDNEREGPRAFTRLPKGAPRPVFRLRRTRAGTGLLLGLVVGSFAVFLVPYPLSTFIFVGAVLLGYVLGRGVRSDVCSEPTCRTPLPPRREDCPQCKGTVAGTIRTAPEHYAAVAEVRRELARALK